MILLFLGFYARLVSSSSINSHLPQNPYMKRPAAYEPEAPLFFEPFGRLNSSSNLAENSTVVEPAAKENQITDEFDEKPATDFLIRIDGSYIPISIDGSVSDPPKSRRRVRRQATQEKPLSELPRWPGMPQGVLRQGNRVQVPLVKKKVLSMMLQSMYSAQERLWPMESVVRKYEHLTPYRMAFIFMKLDQLVHEGHSILMYLERQNTALTMTRRLQLYSHLMRRNIDVTYLVDYISERVPRDQEVRIRQYVIRKEQEKLMDRWKVYEATTVSLPGRNVRQCDNVHGFCQQWGRL